MLHLLEQVARQTNALGSANLIISISGAHSHTVSDVESKGNPRFHAFNLASLHNVT